MNSDRHPRMIYQTPETRERILAVAEELFTRKGLFETQMVDVAAEAELSRTTLYRYFQDKLDLSIAILSRVVDDFDEKSAAEYSNTSGTGIERLECYLRTRWLSPKFFRHRRFLAEFDTYFSGPRLDSEFKKRLTRALRTHPLTDMKRMVAEGIEDGSIRCDIDRDLATVTVFNAVRALSQRLLLRGNVLVEVKRRHLTKMDEELLHLIIDGLRPAAPIHHPAQPVTPKP